VTSELLSSLFVHSVPIISDIYQSGPIYVCQYHSAGRRDGADADEGAGGLTDVNEC
jgi:hypothetical protein